MAEVRSQTSKIWGTLRPEKWLQPTPVGDCTGGYATQSIGDYHTPYHLTN